MKKILLFLVILGALSAITGCILGLTAMQVFGADSLEGSGKIVTRTIPAQDFDAIAASHAVRVVVVDTPDDKIRIEADDNIIDMVVVKTENRVLGIGLEPKPRNCSRIHVTVTVPATKNIRSLHASGASRIRCERTLRAPRIDLKTSGASQIEAPVVCDECLVRASGASKVEVDCEIKACRIELSGASKAEIEGTMEQCEAGASGASKIDLDAKIGIGTFRLSGASQMEARGSAHECTFDLKSASTLSAGDLATEVCTVRTSSASKAAVHCTRELIAEASSASHIVYSGGSRENSIRASGAGSVTPR